VQILSTTVFAERYCKPCYRIHEIFVNGEKIMKLNTCENSLHPSTAS